MAKSLKSLIFCLILLAVIPLASGFSVSTELPSQANYLEEMEIAINIDRQNQTDFDILVILPESWEISEWETSVGQVFAEHRETQYLGENVSAFRWKFENIEQDIIITYKTTAATTGTHQITTLWTYPGGFGSEDFELTVAPLFYAPPTSLLIILFIATGIVISGIIYREYKKYEKNKKRKIKRRKTKSRKKKKLKKKKTKKRR